MRLMELQAMDLLHYLAASADIQQVVSVIIYTFYSIKVLSRCRPG